MRLLNYFTEVLFDPVLFSRYFYGIFVVPYRFFSSYATLFGIDVARRKPRESRVESSLRRFLELFQVIVRPD